ncbi:MAG: hypothetical protein A3F54_02275 [Candidatus Kerfeldbacteria bacterium RIFCSPHIGHO2_12_FULL_48_17]|uniref:DUF4430 domain-containing protein n=1 Tax=Candidatus Kerfeldbacteria bacterium RIFCSPHIGHO2_12_FULL_48_17 TaxID=1798542 RepID=A0A1G2AZL0_9BACT|nr:MAG: hypothetical protein A3F54_02275 [Candidatus Kerfeldbacteria bacterium RIFCSPHIGHO2_12_FULL_48_17]
MKRRDFLLQTGAALTTATVANMIGGAYQCPAEQETCGFFLRDALAIEGLVPLLQKKYEDADDDLKIKCGWWAAGFETSENKLPEAMYFWVNGKEENNKNIGEYEVKAGDIVEIENSLSGKIDFTFVVRTSCLDEPQPPPTTYSPAVTEEKIRARKAREILTPQTLPAWEIR